MKRALYIGRFQPFHKGHLSVIKKILKDFDQVIIIIGSAQHKNQALNPLSAKERKILIEISMEENNVPKNKYKIYKTEDIQDYSKWAEKIKNQVAKFDKLYTGSKIVKECFLGKHGGPTILKVENIINVKRELKISATEIRKRIKQEKAYNEMVPKNVSKKLKEWDIKSRL